MIELLAFVVLSALGGYGIGRTITSETIFEGIVQKIIDFCYYPIGENMTDANGAVFTIDDEGIPEILSKDGYRTDVWRPVSLLLGKIGDLLSCETCASTQSAFQLYFWGAIVGVISLEVMGLFGVIGLTYVVLSKLS